MLLFLIEHRICIKLKTNAQFRIRSHSNSASVQGTLLAQGTWQET